MSIVKISRKQNPFVMIEKSIFEDKTISWAAKGIMGYLLSKPDGWNVNVTDIVNHSPVDEKGQKRRGNGEEAVYKILKELRVHGYAHHEFKRDSKGVILSSEWTVFETKQPYPYKPDTAKPDAAKPDGVQPDHSNNEYSNNEGSNNTILTDSITDLPEKAKPDTVAPSFSQLNTEEQMRVVWLYSKKQLEEIPSMKITQAEKEEKTKKHRHVLATLKSEEFRELITQYKAYRKSHKGIKSAKKWYDSEVTLCACIAELALHAGLNANGEIDMANVRRIYEQTTEKGYIGFFELKGQTAFASKPTEPTQTSKPRGNLNLVADFS